MCVHAVPFTNGIRNDQMDHSVSVIISCGQLKVLIRGQPAGDSILSFVLTMICEL